MPLLYRTLADLVEGLDLDKNLELVTPSVPDKFVCCPFSGTKEMIQRNRLSLACVGYVNSDEVKNIIDDYEVGNVSSSS